MPSQRAVNVHHEATLLLESGQELSLIAGPLSFRGRCDSRCCEPDGNRGLSIRARLNRAAFGWKPCGSRLKLNSKAVERHPGHVISADRHHQIHHLMRVVALCQPRPCLIADEHLLIELIDGPHKSSFPSA